MKNLLHVGPDRNTKKDILKYSIEASFINEDGSIEKWKEGMTEDELMEKIDKEFETFRENFIGKLKNEQSTD